MSEIRRILGETGLAPERLKLEVTESAVLERVEETAQLLSRVKELGVKLCLDDFGTGYSSFNYVRRLPYDTLKIDRSFVGAMDEGSDTEAITHAIVDLAHALGMDVVAEGIETPSQAERLSAPRPLPIPGAVDPRSMRSEQDRDTSRERKRGDALQSGGFSLRMSFVHAALVGACVRFPAETVPDHRRLACAVLTIVRCGCGSGSRLRGSH